MDSPTFEKGGKYAWFVLLILGCIFVQNQWARYSLNYLYSISSDESAKVSLQAATHLSAAEYGILTGYGFSGTFCVMGLVAGRLADVSSRKTVIFFGVVIWNLAMVGLGMSNVFWQLLLWRLVLGVGQAFTNPASYSLIADYFPEEKRAQANGLFACGVYVGGGVASLCIEMADSMGWRKTCFFIAAVGFVFATFDFVAVREPPRAGAAKAATATEAAVEAAVVPTLSESLTEIFGQKIIVIIFIASSFRFMGGYAIAGYLPTFYTTVFPQYSSQYSYINAYVVATGGFLSSWAGGVVADHWLKVEPNARLYLPAVGCFLGIPFFCICTLAPNFYVSILLGLFMEYVVAECWFGPVVAVIQQSLSPTSRALAIACFTLISTFFGSAASVVIGVIYDSMRTSGYDDSCIRWLVLWSVAISYGISGYLFLVASRYMPTKTDEEANKPLLKTEEGRAAPAPVGAKSS